MPPKLQQPLLGYEGKLPGFSEPQVLFCKEGESCLPFRDYIYKKGEELKPCFSFMSPCASIASLAE